MGLINSRSKEKRRAAREARRSTRQSARQERRSERRETRQDRREDRQERRETRQEARQDRREDRQEERQERREERQERVVRRDERALVVYSEFNEDNDPEILRRLYRFVERNGISVAMTVLQGSYDRVIPVTGPAATMDQFIDSLELALFDDGIEEVDVIFNSHGNYKEDERMAYVYFAPDPNAPAGSMEASGVVSAAYLGEKIEELASEERLRMFYTTACWGDHIAEEMVAAGFSCGAGSVDVNTNSAIEYPLFLAAWKAGLPFGTCVRQALKRSQYRTTDAAARLMKSDWWKSADSYKALHGDTSINKRSNADY